MAEPWSNHKDLFDSPPGSIQTVEEGFLLSGNNNQDNQSAIYLFLNFFSSVVSLWFLWWFFRHWPLFFGLIALFSLFSLFSSISRLLALSHFRLLPGELILSHYPLRLGDEYQFTFRRSSKGKRQTLRAGQLIFNLVCVERVEYRRGTDTETEFRTIWNSSPITYPIDSGLNSFVMKGSFQVPINIPPSFECKHNQIRWVVLIQQDLPGIAEKIYSNFTVVVDPVIVL